METNPIQKQAASRLSPVGLLLFRVVPISLGLGALFTLFLIMASWQPHSRRRPPGERHETERFDLDERFYMESDRDLISRYEMRNHVDIDIERIDSAEGRPYDDYYEVNRDRFGAYDDCTLERGIGLEVIDRDADSVTFRVFDDRSYYRLWERCPVGAEIRIEERWLEDMGKSSYGDRCHPIAFGRAQQFWRLPDVVLVEAFMENPLAERCAIMPETHVMHIIIVARQDRPWLLSQVVGQIDAEGACLPGTLFLLPMSEVECR